MIRVHATCVDFGHAAVLLRGPSGVGKSDLAIRLIERGALLVADDQVELEARRGELWARPPAALAGKVEARGVGIMELPHVAKARVRLVVDLSPKEAVERLPEPASCELEGVILPLVRLNAFEASATSKLRLLARTLPAL
jgi:serine kinase of HPr protein (carbohydrate metabolism regulator)